LVIKEVKVHRSGEECFLPPPLRKKFCFLMNDKVLLRSSFHVLILF